MYISDSTPHSHGQTPKLLLTIICRSTTQKVSSSIFSTFHMFQTISQIIDFFMLHWTLPSATLSGLINSWLTAVICFCDWQQWFASSVMLFECSAVWVRRRCKLCFVNHIQSYSINDLFIICIILCDPAHVHFRKFCFAFNSPFHIWFSIRFNISAGKFAHNLKYTQFHHISFRLYIWFLQFYLTNDCIICGKFTQSSGNLFNTAWLRWK